MPDFTPDTYKLLLSTLLDQNYRFQPFADFLRNAEARSVILRHDVDARKMNSLANARLEYELGIKGTYYFRIVPESYDEEVIKQIYELGHEIGYHYEDVSATSLKLYGFKALRQKRIVDEIIIAKTAINSFKENLEKLRRNVPVETICMHGRPLSRWDNRLLWKYYNYRDFGIVGEPYFDIDFEKVLYLTDTGRRWDGGAVAVRDKAQSSGRMAQSKKGQRDEETERRRDWAQGGELRAQGSEVLREEGTERRRDRKEGGGDEGGEREGRRDEETERRRYKKRFHSTFDIINAAKGNRLPDQIMLTVHPQRWDDRPLHWIRELVWQNVKNIVKGAIVKRPGG